MAKYVIDGSTLQNLANAIRKVNGETKSYTPTEMIEAVTNIMESATYILVDEAGNEIPAVYVDSEMVFTATPNDIRIGTTAVNNDGVVTGEKEIPSYYVSEGVRVITSGSPFRITISDFDFKKLQALVCPFNTSLSNSVSTEKVAIDNSVYNVLSTEVVSTIVKDAANSYADFGISNNTETRYLIRYFMYKEVY